MVILGNSKSVELYCGLVVLLIAAVYGAAATCVLCLLSLWSEDVVASFVISVIHYRASWACEFNTCDVSDDLAANYTGVVCSA